MPKTPPRPAPNLPPDLKAFLDAVVIPALLQRLTSTRTPSKAA